MSGVLSSWGLCLSSGYVWMGLCPGGIFQFHWSYVLAFFSSAVMSVYVFMFTWQLQQQIQVKLGINRSRPEPVGCQPSITCSPPPLRNGIPITIHVTAFHCIVTVAFWQVPDRKCLLPVDTLWSRRTLKNWQPCIKPFITFDGCQLTSTKCLLSLNFLVPTAMRSFPANDTI